LFEEESSDDVGEAEDYSMSRYSQPQFETINLADFQADTVTSEPYDHMGSLLEQIHGELSSHPQAIETGSISVAIDGGYAWLAVAAVINTVISLFYYLRPIGKVYFDSTPSAVAVLGGSIRLSLVLVGSALLLAGLAADWLLQLAAAAHLLALIE